MATNHEAGGSNPSGRTRYGGAGLAPPSYSHPRHPEMITPSGKECRFYYQDYFRGRSEQECRLGKANPRSPDWRPADCAGCPVPDILRANSSPDLVLEATVKPGLLGINRHISVYAFCSKHLIEVEKPEVGCPSCASERPGLRELFENLD